MILNIGQQAKINEIILNLYNLDNSIQWVSQDEEVKYKNTEYQNMIIGLGTGNYRKHLTDKTADLYAWSNGVLSSCHIDVYKNNGTGLNGASLISRTEVQDKDLTLPL